MDHDSAEIPLLGVEELDKEWICFPNPEEEREEGRYS